ncbi:hypothetical protein ACHMW6_06525 [Pseudoduganella sp. UC29_106]|uniref:hypothetical protein n=1 Tax=Pseudoduganella sp. UC29_106 TaxID=3374553 RepID=UPI00375803CF
MKWLLILLLAGCATKPITADKPVYAPCVKDVPARPVETFGEGEYPGEVQASKSAVIDLSTWKKYALQLEGVIAGCVPK